MKIKKILSIFLSATIISGMIFTIKYYDYIKSQFYTKLYKIGFKVEEIYINELSLFSIEEIIDQLNFSHGDDIMGIDLSSNKEKLESSFWVSKAKLAIEFPNKINITIYENIPSFIWYNHKQYFAVDDRGKILKKIDLSELERFSNFIILEGMNARSYIQNLLEFIKIDNKLYQSISHVEWVGERRWNIKLTNDLIVKLPQLNPTLAWKHFIDLHREINFFNNKVESIDLRVQDKLFIEFDLHNPINNNLLDTVS